MTIKSKTFLFVLLLFSFISTTAQGRTVYGLMNIGVNFGGDKLVEGTFTNGNEYDIKAGELLSLSTGMAFITNSLETHLSLGYKFDSVTAANGEIEFYRFPLDLVYLYKIKNFRIGGGLTYHLSPKLKSSGAVSFIKADFDDALGYLLQTQYMIDNLYSIGLRYTAIDYKVDNPYLSSSINGNSIGLLMTIIF